MMIIPLGAVSLTMQIVGVLFILSCLALMGVVLIQKGRGGGLGGAITGAIGTGLFGTKTGDFLTWVTITMTAIFLFLAVVMGLFYRPTISQIETPAPMTAPVQVPQQEGQVTQPISPAEQPRPAGEQGTTVPNGSAEEQEAPNKE